MRSLAKGAFVVTVAGAAVLEMRIEVEEDHYAEQDLSKDVRPTVHCTSGLKGHRKRDTKGAAGKFNVVLIEKNNSQCAYSVTF